MTSSVNELTIVWRSSNHLSWFFSEVSIARCKLLRKCSTNRWLFFHTSCSRDVDLDKFSLSARLCLDRDTVISLEKRETIMYSN